MNFRNYIVLITILFLSACGKKSPCFKGAGDFTSDFIEVDDVFSSISLHDDINIVLIDSPSNKIEVEAGENLIPFVEAKVINGSLELRNNNKCDFLRGFKHQITIYISISNIEKIDYYGTGNITSVDTLRYSDFLLEVWDGMGSINLTLKSDKVSIKEHLGAADITLNGQANDSYYYLISEGWFYFDKFISKDVFVFQGGYGDISLHASQNLTIDKNSFGNIDFYGNPSVTVISDKGSGSINKK